MEDSEIAWSRLSRPNMALHRMAARGGRFCNSGAGAGLPSVTWSLGRMRSLELKVPPLALTVVFAAAMFGVSTITPAATFSVPGRRIMAVGLALVAAVIAFAGVVAFRANKTTVNPVNPGAAAAIVSSGVYRFSRNPMYLGFLLALVAWAIQLSNALAALFLPVFVAYMNQFQIKPEERTLLAKFGPAFSQYVAAVRRWV